MKEETKRTLVLAVISLMVVIVAVSLTPLLSHSVAIKPKCFFAGDQWGKQEVKFFSDPNNELKRVTYTDFVSLDPNSPDWETWQKRYREFLSEKSIAWEKPKPPK